jgi:hypothetical protein
MSNFARLIVQGGEFTLILGHFPASTILKAGNVTLAIGYATFSTLRFHFIATSFTTQDIAGSCHRHLYSRGGVWQPSGQAESEGGLQRRVNLR